MRKFAIGFLAIFLVLIAGFFIARQTILRVYVSPKIPEIIAPSPVNFPTNTSHFLFPFSISIPAIQNLLDTSFQMNFSGVKKDPMPGDTVYDDKATWNITRSHLSLLGQGPELQLKLNVGGQAHGEGKIGPPWAPTKIEGDVNFSGRVDGKCAPTFNPNWTIAPNASAQVYVNNVSIDLGQVAKGINITNAISDFINSEKDGFISKFNEAVGRDQTLRRSAEKEWQNLFLAIRVHESPDVWFRVAPKAVIAKRTLDIQGDQLHFGVGIAAETQIILGKDSPKNPISPLPQLVISGHIPKDFKLALPVFVPWKEINGTLVSLVAGKSFDLDGGSSISVEEITITPSAQALLVKIGFTATKSNWIQGAKGTIFLTGRPILDSVGKTFRVTELKYDLATENLLLQVADWLLKPQFLGALEKSMMVDLEEYRKKGLEQGNSEIQKIKAKLPQGVSLDLKFTDIGFDRFNYDAENLYLAFMAAGECGATLKNLDFSLKMKAPAATPEEKPAAKKTTKKKTKKTKKAKAEEAR